MDFSGASGPNFRVIRIEVNADSYLETEFAQALVALEDLAKAQGKRVLERVGVLVWVHCVVSLSRGWPSHWSPAHMHRDTVTQA
jgi:hypothetical protein